MELLQGETKFPFSRTSSAPVLARLRPCRQGRALPDLIFDGSSGLDEHSIRLELRIRLTPPEARYVTIGGGMRRCHGLEAGLELGRDPKNAWAEDIEGAGGEFAVAKYLGLPWSSTVGIYDAPDVGHYHVRTDLSRHRRTMVIRPGDFTKRNRPMCDDDICIGVLSYFPEFIIMGWKRVGDCKEERWLDAPDQRRPKAWFVPESALEPMDTLPGMEDAAREFYRA
jgi:hypothetical protein